MHARETHTYASFSFYTQVHLCVFRDVSFSTCIYCNIHRMRKATKTKVNDTAVKLILHLPLLFQQLQHRRRLPDRAAHHRAASTRTVMNDLTRPFVSAYRTTGAIHTKAVNRNVS